MKARNLKSFLAVAVAGSLVMISTGAMAEDATNNVAPPPMTYAVTDLVKLAQAKVSADTMLAYVRNSKIGYFLNSSQIIYLRQQGVPENVIIAMLDKPTAEVATAPVSTVQPPAQSFQQPVTPAPAPPAPVTTYVAAPQPSVTYIQTPAPTYYYAPDYYPSYGYYGWPYPAIGLSFGFGGRWGGSGWHGGGGGWHGGGHGGHH